MHDGATVAATAFKSEIHFPVVIKLTIFLMSMFCIDSFVEQLLKKKEELFVINLH